MSDLGKLREALAYFGNVARPAFPELEMLLIAVHDYLTLLESDAIVIRRDGEGNWPDEAHQTARRWKASNDGTHHLFNALAAPSKATE